MDINQKNTIKHLEQSTDYNLIWDIIKKDLIIEIGILNYQKWFNKIKIKNFQKDHIKFIVNSPIDKFWIDNNYKNILLDLFLNKFNKNLKITFEVDKNRIVNKTITDNNASIVDNLKCDNYDEYNNYNPSSSPNFTQHELYCVNNNNSPLTSDTNLEPNQIEKKYAQVYRKNSPIKPNKLKNKNLLNHFNPQYRFSNFITSKKNEVIKDSARSLCDNSKVTFNPLFIYGKSGLGKTHILHAISQELILTKDKKVCYKTGENFTNDYIDSIKNGKLAPFRRKYRNCDVLIIDDIQFISGKVKSMEEFFHTFNSLIDKNKQVIITSDKSPKELKTLKDKLLTRLQWGLTLRIEKPDFETRLHILQQKCHEWNIFLDDKTLFLIAEKVSANVRFLEGALRRISSFQSLSKQNVSLDVINRLINDLVSTEKKSPSIKKIRNYVAKKFKLSKDDILSNSRSKKIIIPRQLAMALSRELTNKSLTEIGAEFGGKKHSHVIHAIKSFEKKKSTEKEIYQIYISSLNKFK